MATKQPAIDIKKIKNELEDMSAALREFEDKEQQQLYDLIGGIKSLAITADVLIGRVQDLQDQIHDKIRNISNSIEEIRE